MCPGALTCRRWRGQRSAERHDQSPAAVPHQSPPAGAALPRDPL